MEGLLSWALTGAPEHPEELGGHPWPPECPLSWGTLAHQPREMRPPAPAERSALGSPTISSRLELRSGSVTGEETHSLQTNEPRLGCGGAGPRS